MTPIESESSVGRPTQSNEVREERKPDVREGRRESTRVRLCADGSGESVGGIERGPDDRTVGAFQAHVETRLRAQYGDDVRPGDDVDFRVDAWPVNLTVLVVDSEDDLLDAVARAMVAANDGEHAVVVYPEVAGSDRLQAVDEVTLVPLGVDAE